MVCEQVSHHPPISAFYIENVKKGIYCNGHNGQKSKFSASSMWVDQPGQVILHLQNRDNESYLITLPSLSVNGIMLGSPYVELLGTSYIQSSTGFCASISYSGVGWLFQGEKNYFKAVIKDFSSSFSPQDLYTIEGQWSGKSKITKQGSKSSQLFYNATGALAPEKIFKPFDEQNLLESQKIWARVSKAIIAKDYETARIEKEHVENDKRIEKKNRELQGKEWKAQYFDYLVTYDVFKVLSNALFKNVGKDKKILLGNGSWVSKQFLKTLK